MFLTVFLYLTDGEKALKGRTTCPKCNHDYILDIPEDTERYKTICPNCNKWRTVNAGSIDIENKLLINGEWNICDECGHKWIKTEPELDNIKEHGLEPVRLVEYEEE